MTAVFPYKNLGSRIEAVRIGKGISEEEMANKLQLPLMEYLDIEKGKIFPKPIQQIANILELSIEEFMKVGDFSGQVYVTYKNSSINHAPNQQYSHQLTYNALPSGNFEQRLTKIERLLDLLIEEREAGKTYQVDKNTEE